jgi:hypothetical protein
MDFDDIEEFSATHKAALVLLLVLVDFLIFWLDLSTGSAISLQPLYVIPVVVAGVLLGNISLVFLAILSTLLRVEGYRRTAFTGTDFPYLLNIAATFATMLIVGGVVAFARHFRDRSRTQHLSNVGRRIGNLPRLDE